MIDKELNSFDLRKLLWNSVASSADEVHLGIYRDFPPFTELHTHDFFECFLILEGRMRHRLEKPRRDFEVFRGCLTLIRPEDCHGFARITSESCALANLAFSRQTFEHMLSFLGIEEQQSQLEANPLPPMVRLNETELHMRSECLSGLFGRPTVLTNPHLRATVAEWLSRFVNPLPSTDSELPNWLLELCEAMRRKENFLQGLSRLQSLAARSPEHVARSFKRYLGRTPSAFINEQKLAYACQLLSDGSLPVIEVALESGFSEQAYFNRLFKARYHCTPTEFRARARKPLP